MYRVCCAIALVTVCLATTSRGALPETGCPGSWAGTGEATYYLATGTNACSLPVGPDEYIAAVAEAAYDGSAVCGRCVRITGPLGSIVAHITDYCVGPGCRDFDLSPSAFSAIGNPLDGIIPVSWESVACDVAGPISFYYDPGSNPYYGKIQVRNHRYGIAGLSIKPAGAGSYVALDRSVDNAFEYLPGAAIPAPLSFQVTDLHGVMLEESGLAFAPGGLVAGSGQFPVCPEPGSALGGAAGVGALALLDQRRRRLI